MGRATIQVVPLVTPRSHGNVRVDSESDEPVCAADNSDVPAAAMLEARPFCSARGSSRSSAQVRHSLPSCSRPVALELTVATGSSRSSVVHSAPGYLYPCRHSQAVKPLLFGRTLTQYLVTLHRTKRRVVFLPLPHSWRSTRWRSSLGAPTPPSLPTRKHR